MSHEENRIWYMQYQNNPSDPSLKDILAAAEVIDTQPIKGFNIRQAIIRAIHRTVQIVEGCERESKRHEIAQSILKEAGLK